MKSQFEENIESGSSEGITKKGKEQFSGVRPTPAFIGAAWASLGRISALAPTNARGRDLARRAHEIAEKLPDGPMQRVRTGLAQRAGL